MGGGGGIIISQKKQKFGFICFSHFFKKYLRWKKIVFRVFSFQNLSHDRMKPPHMETGAAEVFFFEEKLPLARGKGMDLRSI